VNGAVIIKMTAPFCVLRWDESWSYVWSCGTVS